MNTLQEQFGNRIKELRTNYGYSQDVLHTKTHILRENISKIENGQFNVTLKTIEKLANAFNIDAKELFNFASDNNVKEEKHYIQPHPFVKWAGGKTQLIPEILTLLPESFNTYYEPFVGGGAVFFNIQPKDAVINDNNQDLMAAYNCFCNKKDYEALMKALSEHEKLHNEEYYYEIRNLDRDEAFSTLSDVVKAARMIYLNKACFNGLYRVNSKGFFNVPSGRKAKVNTFEEANFESIHHYFINSNIKLLNTDFEECVSSAQKGDFVYFDPPYDTFEKGNNFTSYSKGGFGKEEQVRLRDVYKALSDKGVYVLLSNHNTEFIRDLYKEFDINVIQAKRMINSKASGRGNVEEVLIKNYR